MKKFIKGLFVFLLIVSILGRSSSVVRADGHEYTYDDLTEGMTYTGEDSLLLSLNGNTQMWITVLVNGSSSLGTLTYNDYTYRAWEEDCKYKLISKNLELRPDSHWIGYTISFYKYSVITIDPNGATVTTVPEGWVENNGKYQKEYLYPDLLSAALAEWDDCLEYDGYEFIEWEHNYDLEDDYINYPMEIKARWLSDNTAKVCIDPLDSDSFYVPRGFEKNADDGKYYKRYSIGTKISDITEEIDDAAYAEPKVLDDDYAYYMYRFVHRYDGHEDAETLEGDGLTYYPEFSKRLEIEIETSGFGSGTVYDEEGYQTSEIYLATGATYSLRGNTFVIYNNGFKNDEEYMIVEDDDSKFIVIKNLPEESFTTEITLDFVFDKVHEEIIEDKPYTPPCTGID